MADRYCSQCGRVRVLGRRKYCGACRAARGLGPSTSARGYGTSHQKLRSEWAVKVAAGGVRCARGAACRRAEGKLGGLISPSEPFDLDHSDVDRSQYLGPSHVACNRSASAAMNVLLQRRHERWFGS